MSLGISGIDHVQIAVPRVLETECLAFYRCVLGLCEIPKPEEMRARGGAWFQLENVQLHIGVDAEPSPRSKRHICFRVADVERARQELARLGFAIEEDGARRFFMRDPAGNRIEIGQATASGRSP